MAWRGMATAWNGSAAKVPGCDTADPGSSPSVNELIFGLLGGLNRKGIAVLVNASMALALSAHTPRVQVIVYDVCAGWRSELG